MIWIDIDNTPHVLFFEPIIRELEEKGYPLFVTARDYGGIVELLNKKNITYHLVGKDYGKSKIKKVLGSIGRIFDLLLLLQDKDIDVSIGHGSRTHVGAAFLAGIPRITCYDYEFVSKKLLHLLATKVLVPDAIPDQIYTEKKVSLENVLKYDGYKEEVYLCNFEPVAFDLAGLGVPEDKILILVRPPATSAHYYVDESGMVFSDLMSYLLENKDAFILLLPRDKSQIEALKSDYSERKEIKILEKPVDGIILMWNADMIISGGGTMIREGAVLGIPSYSTFQGELGAVDRKLIENNRLVMINGKEDFSKIKIKKRDAINTPKVSSKVKDFIIGEILKFIK